MPAAQSSRPNLLADCSQCFGLCCVALPFTASSDFAIDKRAGEPCRHLRSDSRCGIHRDLRQHGFGGCTVYDCFGAGQQVAQTTFGGRDWRSEPAAASQMFAVLPVMRQLHEFLWYLTDVTEAPAAEPVHPDARRAIADVEALTGGTAEDLLLLDLPVLGRRVDDLLQRASELVRGEYSAHREGNDRRDGKAVAPKPARSAAAHRGADLMGARLRRADLRGGDLRGAYLIGADLRDADLRGADLIGADLRGADLRGSDLRGCLFLTQFQVNAAMGDEATRLSPTLLRPGHWSRAPSTRP